MSAAIDTRGSVASSVPANARLSFPRVIKSEWIKLRSLRSTIWTLSITVVLMIGMSILVAFGFKSAVGQDPSIVGDWTAPAQVNTVAAFLAQLSVAVLGVLVIGGEYGTGMIRATMTAVPRRIPAVIAKMTVLALTTFVVTVVAVFVSYLVTTPILSSANLDAGINGSMLRVFIGLGLYLSLIALMSLGLGALIRNSAGAISASLGILLLLPLLVQIVGNFVSWVPKIMKWLPSSAGTQIMSTTETAPGDLSPWQGLGMLALYTAVIAIAALVLLRRRDV